MTQIAPQGAAVEDLVEIREGEYGGRLAAIEPGGSEFIPLDERHGRPIKLFSTWMSPNFEFATVFVGVLCIPAFGLTFTQSVLAIVIGTVLGSITHGVLSARGPQYGVPQMVLSRISFGYWGNILPAGINAFVAGIGWFAVNSVSGALALSSLFHWNDVVCLLIVVLLQIGVAFLGHNLVHFYEALAFPVLLVIFAIMAAYTFAHAHYAHPVGGAGFGGFGGFMLAVAASFGYAVGWNPYASDYTRYLSPQTSKRATGLWAGLGVAISCIFLEIVGAASATIAGGQELKLGPGPFVAVAPKGVADATLIAIAIGAIAANALNIYSGAMSFSTLGIRMHAKYRRAFIALVFGVIGFFVAWSGLSDAGTKYNDFLLVIAYWIGPWLAVVLLDQLLRKGDHTDLLFNERHTSWSGPIAMFLGMAVSILLFSDQTDFTGFIARIWDSPTNYGIGDLTFEVGIVVTAVVYGIGYSIENRRRTISLPA